MEKSNKLKIVWTVGAFDILHPNHIKFLKEAKKYGTHLWTGVHSDRTIFNYKGKLPIFTLQERIYMLEQLKFVDRVMVAKMTSEITEDFYKKNNIYLHVQALNEKDSEDWYELPKRLGIFKKIPYQNGISTSEIIRRIKDRK